MAFLNDTVADPAVLEARIRATNSVFASQVVETAGYALTRYRSQGDMLRVNPLCGAETVDGLADAFFALKDTHGKPYEVSILVPKEYDRRYFPLLTIDGQPRILQLGHPSYCLSFDQPGLWRTAIGAREHARKMPSMAPAEQERFLTLLLPRAKRL